MNKRDKNIIESLEKFRVLTRDDIAELHFGNVKRSVTQTNMVMKRLCRDGYVEVCKETRMYRYFPIPSIRKQSSKIPHFLAIADFYKQLRKVEEDPRVFEVEPKLGNKGTVEPDIFMIWKNAPFFVELQLRKGLGDKMKKYEEYFYSDAWYALPWQPREKKVFPRVWIVTEQQYRVMVPFKVIQTRNVEEFMQSYVRASI